MNNKKTNLSDSKFEGFLLSSEYLAKAKVIGSCVEKMKIGSSNRDLKPVKDISIALEDILLGKSSVESYEESVPCLLLKRLSLDGFSRNKNADIELPLLCPVCGGPAHIDANVSLELGKQLRGFQLSLPEIVWRSPGDAERGILEVDERPDTILLNAFSYCKNANPGTAKVPMVFIWLEKAPAGKTFDDDYSEAEDDAIMLLHPLSLCLAKIQRSMVYDLK